MVAYYWLEPKTQTQEMYVSAIMVHPNYRDSGIGSYCLRMADFEALSRDYVKCSLTVDPWNGRGVYSYLKHNYLITAYDLDHWGPNAHRFVMEKDLSGKNINPGNEQITVSCDDNAQLVEITKCGFVGTNLIKSQDGDPRHNLIVFKKRNKNVNR